MRYKRIKYQPHTKEDIIECNAYTQGIFEVIKLELEEDELFDAQMLEDKISSLVSENKSNIAVDISPLDYIYSDSINKIMNINRKILDANGRFALLSPQEETLNVLQRSGITNFIKIYSSEDELARSSEEILKQTTSFSTDELKKGAPKSEFDDLRSEIGQAFAGDVTPPAEVQEKPYEPVELEKEPPSPPQQPQAPSNQHVYPPESQQVSGTEDYFGPQAGGKTPDSEAFYGQGPAREEPFQQPQEQQRPPTSGIRGTPDTGGRDEAYFAPPSQPQASYPQEGFRPESRPEAPQVSAEDDDLRHKDIFEEEEKKGFPVGIFIVGLVAIGLIAGIVTLYFAYFEPSSFLTKERPAKQEVVETPQIEEKAITEEESAEDEEPEEPKESVKKSEPSTAGRTAARSPRTSKIRYKRSPKPEKEKTVSRRTAPPEKTQTSSSPAVSSAEKTFSAAGRAEEPSSHSVTSSARSSSGISKSAPSTPSVSREPEKAEPAEEIRKPETSTPSVKRESIPQQSKPAVSEAPVSSAPTGEPATVFIATFPPMADVYMDGKRIGKGNVDELKVRSGTHTMKFVKGAQETTQEMTFKPGKNPSKVIKLP